MLPNPPVTVTPCFFQTQPILKVDMAILAPMSLELDYVRARLQGKLKLVKKVIVDSFEFNIYEYNQVTIVDCATGIGTASASSAMSIIYFYFRPTYAFLVGTAGGIKQEVVKNEVVVTDRVFEAEMHGLCEIVKDTPFASCFIDPLTHEYMPQLYSTDAELLEIAKEMLKDGIKLHIGTTVTSNAFPAPRELFARIKELHAVSIDMEGSAFYQAARRFKVKVIAIRGTSNVLDENGADKDIDKSDIKNSTIAATDVLLQLIDRLIEKKYTQLDLLTPVDDNHPVKPKS